MSVLMLLPEAQIIALISVVLVSISLTVRKMVVDQDKLKAQKAEMKELQKKMKEAQKAGNQKEMTEMYSKVMGINSSIMKQSFKPMIFTLIPFLLVLSWMRGTYDHAITDVVVLNELPESFTVEAVNLSDGGSYNKSSNTLTWRVERIEGGLDKTVTGEIKGGGPPPGNSMLYYRSGGDEVIGPVESGHEGDIVFTQTIEESNDGLIVTLLINNTQSNVVAAVFGYELGWLGWYFMCSMIISLALNKIFKMS